MDENDISVEETAAENQEIEEAVISSAEEKSKRIKIAVIVGAVLLVVILLAVLLYQIIAISNERRFIDEYNNKIAYYRELKDDADKVLEVRETYQWLERVARENGWILPNDVVYPV